MEYYLVIKKNKVFIHTSKFMNLEKHKAEQKDVWYDFICIQFWERQNYSHKKSRFVGAEDLGSGEGIDCTGGSRNFFFLVIVMFSILGVIVITRLYIISKVNQTVSLM